MSELSADEARKTSTWVDEGVKEKEEGVMTADRERGGGEEVRSDDMSNAFRVENDLADSKHGGRDSEVRIYSCCPNYEAEEDSERCGASGSCLNTVSGRATIVSGGSFRCSNFSSYSYRYCYVIFCNTLT